MLGMKIPYSTDLSAYADKWLYQEDSKSHALTGVDATLAWSWDEGHVGVDPLNTSFTAWLDGIC